MAIDWHSPIIIDKVRRGAVRGVTSGIGIVENHAVLLITTGTKSGRVYTRRGVRHQASAPGESPASDTGRLVQSRRIIIDAQAIRARLNFSTDYARALEMGTRRMEPRPYARRALAQKEKEIRAAISAEIMLELRR